MRSAESAPTGRRRTPCARPSRAAERWSAPPDFRLSPSTWGFLARVCWWYLGHHEGQETRAQAEARAEQAADLVVEAAGSGDVVVLAHGFFNHLIGRALKRRGWRLSMSEGYKYWSMRRFERV
jgi:broad specificity phosphatase PhoE